MYEPFKVGLFEVRYHEVFLATLIEILQSGGVGITVFTTPNIRETVELMLNHERSDITWIENRDNSTTSFLRRVVTPATADLDLLILNTVQGLSTIPVSRCQFKCPVVMVAGRIDEWFGSRLRFLNQPSARAITREALADWFRPTVLRRVDALITHSEASAVLASRKWVEKPVIVVPFAGYNMVPSLPLPAAPFRFSIVGMIAKHRRDYFGVLSAFENLWARHGDRVELFLLGRPIGKYGQKVLEQAVKLKNAGNPIQFYSQYIPEKEYQECVRASHALINPLLPATYPYGGFTAGLVEAIRNARPGIYPDWYEIPESLQNSTIRYSSVSEIQKLVEENWLTPPNAAKELLASAKKGAESFTCDQLANSLIPQLRIIGSSDTG